MSLNAVFIARNQVSSRTEEITLQAAKFPTENLVCVWEERKGLYMGVR